MEKHTPDAVKLRPLRKSDIKKISHYKDRSIKTICFYVGPHLVYATRVPECGGVGVAIDTWECEAKFGNVAVVCAPAFNEPTGTPLTTIATRAMNTIVNELIKSNRALTSFVKCTNEIMGKVDADLGYNVEGK